jgi:hypothetical protein
MAKFVTLRDAYGSTQLVSTDDVSRNKNVGENIKTDVVVWTGFVWFGIM